MTDSWSWWILLSCRPLPERRNAAERQRWRVGRSSSRTTARSYTDSRRQAYSRVEFRQANHANAVVRLPSRARHRGKCCNSFRRECVTIFYVSRYIRTTGCEQHLLTCWSVWKESNWFPMLPRTRSVRANMSSCIGKTSSLWRTANTTLCWHLGLAARYANDVFVWVRREFGTRSNCWRLTKRWRPSWRTVNYSYDRRSRRYPKFAKAELLVSLSRPTSLRWNPLRWWAARRCRGRRTQSVSTSPTEASRRKPTSRATSPPEWSTSNQAHRYQNSSMSLRPNRLNIRRWVLVPPSRPLFLRVHVKALWCVWAQRYHLTLSSERRCASKRSASAVNVRRRAIPPVPTSSVMVFLRYFP